ncbi:MAG: zinc ribbon domain-containing protein [Lachnospiraceae bacterium]|nr:zinc ribbon domain-containing protein [Lachnospiraceae bacterium]
MTKGKFGLSLASIAAIAFAFCVFQQPQSVLLIAGFALLAEKEEWLNRQVFQALFLTIAYYITNLVLGWIFRGLARFFGWIEVYKVQNGLLTINSVVSSLLYIALVALSIIAILRLLRGQEANLPFISKFAVGDLTSVFEKPTKAKTSGQYAAAPPVQNPPLNPQYEAKPQSSVTNTETSPEIALETTAAAERVCPSCHAPLKEDSKFCTQCGTKVE